MEMFDHIVIVAGIVGSCAAWQLAKQKRKVLLLEQFHLPHTRGSSTGQTRLIRTCYEEEYFAKIMPDAFELWRQIEEEVGSEIIVKTGVVCVTDVEETFQKVLANLKKYTNGQYEVLTADERKVKYPYLKYSDEYQSIYDKTGGVIRANKAIAAVQELFKKNGGQICDGQQVDSVDIKEDSVQVVLQDGATISCKSLVACSGAWTAEIFHRQEDIAAKLRKYLKAIAVKVWYWKFREGTDSSLFPTFLDCSALHFYGLSPVEYPGMMKASIHGGTVCNPDERDKAVFNEQELEDLKTYLKKHLPELESEPAITERCMYTETPDNDFIVDYLYEHKNVVLGCGFSGTGFKTAPVIGKLLSELAMGQKPTHVEPRFKLSRFH